MCLCVCMCAAGCCALPSSGVRGACAVRPLRSTHVLVVHVVILSYHTPCITWHSMWDTAGQERFKSLLPMYLRGAHIALLCYSVTDIHSFENLESVIHMVQEQCGQDVVLVVVGCKADLAPEGEPRQGRVPFASAIEFAERVGGLVFETSAKNGDGVDEALFAAAEMAVAAKRRKGDPVVKGLQVGGTRGSGTGPSGACLC